MKHSQVPGTSLLCLVLLEYAVLEGFVQVVRTTNETHNAIFAFSRHLQPVYDTAFVRPTDSAVDGYSWTLPPTGDDLRPAASADNPHG